MDMNDLLAGLMNNSDFMNAFIQKIAEEVIKRLKNRPKKALVVFTGAAIGYKEAVAELAKLKEAGWQFTVYFSDAAANVLDGAHLKETLGIDKIYTQADHAGKAELVEGIDEVIIATTTVNTAAKIANGICDNQILTLISQQIMSGGKVVCAVNGACPDNKVRADLGMGKSPKAYRELLKNNLRAMRDYGIKMIAADEMYDVCTGTPAGAAPTEEPQSQNCAVETAAKPAGQPEFIDKHIISRPEILKGRDTGIVRIKEDAIVTMYAQETAKEFGIQIERV